MIKFALSDIEDGIKSLKVGIMNILDYVYENNSYLLNYPINFDTVKGILNVIDLPIYSDYTDFIVVQYKRENIKIKFEENQVMFNKIQKPIE